MSCSPHPNPPHAPNTTHPTTTLIGHDDFRSGLARWTAELEQPGLLRATDGTLTLDVPAGATLWLNQPLTGPLVIDYRVTLISAGGPNDRVSDLNCFWMATDARSPDNLFATPRSGKFADYDHLRCYYVGYGGNANTTTRFRRYIGEKSNRPLLPQHDLRDPQNLLTPNQTYRIRLIADGSRIQFWRDDTLLFNLTDPNPYTTGHFAFRTVASHMRISHFSIYRPSPGPATTRP